MCVATAPNDSPQNVSATSFSSTTIDVSWEEVPLADRNGLIITYEVLFEPLETFGQLTISETRNTTNLSIGLDNLHPFVEYNISVRAYTSVGFGPYSDVSMETTQQDRKSTNIVVPINLNIIESTTRSF